MSSLSRSRWARTAISLLGVALFVAAGWSQSGGVVESPSRAAALAKAENWMQQGQPRSALQTLLDLHRTYPDDAEVSQRIGNVYAGLKELPKAAEFLQKALQSDPSLLSARKGLAVVLWFLDRKKESEQEFKTVASKTPSDPVPHLYLGLAAYERKEYRDAKTHFRQAGDLAIKNPEVLPAVLESYLSAGDSSLNSNLLGMIESARNPNPELVFRIGSIFGSHQSYDEAVRAFDKIKGIYPDRYAILSSLAKAQVGGGHPSDAEATLREIVGAGLAKPETYVLLSEAYDRQNQPDQAYDALQKGIDLAPEQENGYVELAKFAVAHQNDEFALRTLERGLERDPSSAALLMQRGLIQALRGRVEEAEASFLRASEAAPNWNHPLLALGVSQMEAGQWETAAATFSKAASVDPSDYRAPYFRAEALSRSDRAESLPDVVASLKEAISLNPRDPKSHASLGAAYLSAGRTEEAVPTLERALELDPDNQTALYRLSRAYHSLGKTDQAKQYLERFQESKAKSRAETEETELVQRLTIIRE